MTSIDPEVVRHALKTAQEHGFAEVELGVDGASFRARLEPGPKKSAKQLSKEGDSVTPAETEPNTIKSPIVGFYRLGPSPLQVGGKVQPGDVVAIVNALGIANDVESHVGGEIVEVLVEDGQPVEFGQVLAKVKA